MSTSAPPLGLHKPSFFDIGVNLTDEMYSGLYHGKKAHAEDLDQVMQRAQSAGVMHQMVTVGQLDEVEPALALTKRYDGLFCTAGVHPTRTSQVGEGDTYLDKLRAILDQHGKSEDNSSGRIVAIGEVGLDYDRLHFSPRENQLRHFGLQLELAGQYRLPLFLHCRAAHDDLVSLLAPHLHALAGEGKSRAGVVHCFTGSTEEMQALVKLGLFVGLTGCSLKTEQGIQVARDIPLDRLLLETDAPWCDMRATHASAPFLAAFNAARPDLTSLYQPASVKKEKWEVTKCVKGRNEPCAIGSVAAIVAKVKGVDIEVVANASLDNARFLFGI